MNIATRIGACILLAALWAVPLRPAEALTISYTSSGYLEDWQISVTVLNEQGVDASLHFVRISCPNQACEFVSTPAAWSIPPGSVTNVPAGHVTWDDTAINLTPGESIGGFTARLTVLDPSSVYIFVTTGWHEPHPLGGNVAASDSHEFILSVPPSAPLDAVPVPAALPLFATGLGALGLLGWRRKRKQAAGTA